MPQMAVMAQIVATIFFFIIFLSFSYTITKEQNIMFAPLHHIRNYSRNEQVRQWDVILCGYLYGKEGKNVVKLH